MATLHGRSPVTRLRIATGLVISAMPVACSQQAIPEDASASCDPALSFMHIKGEADKDGTVAPPFLPDVEGTRVFAGKKATVVDFDAMPQVQTDNYRQALSKVPGLLVSELSNASLLSLGYRGVGDPHESQNLLVLKDGVPFVVDLYGYPTVYYAPPFESVDRLEFVRGGASLLYGPQPSGALNYVTHQPRTDRAFALRTQHVFGSYDLYATHTLVDGTRGRLGYLASLDHRQGNGFRRLNSDFDLLGGSVRLVVDGNTDSRWTLDFDATAADSGEPGGLSLQRGPGVLNYEDDRRQAQKLFDRVRVERYMPTLSYERDFDESTRLTLRGWGGSYERYSKRQIGDGFGTVSGLADANNIDVHQYYIFGTDARLRKDYELVGEYHTLVGGFSTYWSDAPVRREQGAAADADEGRLVRASQRDTLAGSVFAENVFNVGPLSIVPGLRIENISQSIRETSNVARPNALLSDTDLDVVPLVALGTAYRLPGKSEVYGNVSQGYKAKAYGDAIPVDSNNATVSDTLSPGNSWTYEVGLRGQPRPWVTYDASLFLIDYNDRFGRVVLPGGAVRVENVGRSINRGVDLATELDVMGLLDGIRGTDWAANWGGVSLYANASLLDARFVAGPLDGRTPQYAPDYLVRSGVIYRLGGRARVAFLGTFLGEHFADDSNSSNWRVPAYQVWDLTAEFTVWKDVRVLAGLNNVFDTAYYSRIRSNGIDPAVGRNFYAGFSALF